MDGDRQELHEVARPREDATDTLRAYRAFLQAELGLDEQSAISLTPDSHRVDQAYFLTLVDELLDCSGIKVPSDIRTLLQISCYARFRAVVSMDALLDEGNPEQKPRDAQELYIHADAALRASLAAGLSVGKPQLTFNRLTRVYLKTVAVERNPASHTNTLARLLFRKSSMVLLPVAWASHLGAPSLTVTRGRAAAIKLFIALQIFDDVKDLEKDVALGQHTLLLNEIKARLPETNPHEWTITHPIVREVMVNHLAIAVERARDAALIYQRLGARKLAGSAFNAMSAANTLRQRLELYGLR